MGVSELTPVRRPEPGAASAAPPAAFRSCLYECSVMHQRLVPRPHRFQYNLFMFYLDLDELDQLATQTPLFSRNRRNVYSFWDADHLQLSSADLKQNLALYLAQQGVAFPAGGRIMLLTLPRVLGYIFNPVSFYFCFDAQGVPLCAVAEVGNTFREQKPFLVAREDSSGDRFRRVAPKHFYVSPFSSLELKFDFKLRLPEGRLELHINDLDAQDQPVLLSALAGTRAPFTNARLAWYTLKYPLLTLRVIFLIHWHALLLYWKKIPFHRKAANAALQRDVYRPHSSLARNADESTRPLKTFPQ